MIFKSSYDYEELDDYYCLNLTIEYEANKAEKRTGEYPGCEAHIAIESISINRIEDSLGKTVIFPEEMMNKIREDVEKREWDVIIGEYLSEQSEFERDEYYDSKFDESRGC